MHHFNLVLRGEPLSVLHASVRSLLRLCFKSFRTILKTLKRLTFSLNSFSSWFVIKCCCGLLILLLFLVFPCIGLMEFCNKMSEN